jgi:hypothetical protein
MCDVPTSVFPPSSVVHTTPRVPKYTFSTAAARTEDNGNTRRRMEGPGYRDFSLTIRVMPARDDDRVRMLPRERPRGRGRSRGCRAYAMATGRTMEPVAPRIFSGRQISANS